MDVTIKCLGTIEITEYSFSFKKEKSLRINISEGMKVIGESSGCGVAKAVLKSATGAQASSELRRHKHRTNAWKEGNGKWIVLSKRNLVPCERVVTSGS